MHQGQADTVRHIYVMPLRTLAGGRSDDKNRTGGNEPFERLALCCQSVHAFQDEAMERRRGDVEETPLEHLLLMVEEQIQVRAGAWSMVHGALAPTHIHRRGIVEQLGGPATVSACLPSFHRLQRQGLHLVGMRACTLAV